MPGAARSTRFPASYSEPTVSVTGALSGAPVLFLSAAAGGTVALKVGVGLFTGQIPASSTRTFHQEYRDYLDLVRRIESSGLDAAWVSEHHFSEDGYLPSLTVMLAAFAAVTERIELGTGVVLAPFHDPLRLAEDFAVVDQLSGGRTIAGFGIGWRDEEFRSFNLDVGERVRRMKEIVEILRLAWNEDRFSY